VPLLATLLCDSLISSALAQPAKSLRAAARPAEGREINQRSSHTQALEIVQGRQFRLYLQEHLPCGSCQEEASCIKTRRKVVDPHPVPRSGGTRRLRVPRGWQRRRSHFPQVVHRIVRPVRDPHLLENELLKVIVRFLPSHAVGMANHGGQWC
jgi:hypothetical protein